MNTTPENKDRKGQTIFVEYSRSRKGQHFITVLHYLPEANRKVLIGRVTRVQAGERFAYRADSGDHKQTLAESQNLKEIKKYFKDNGRELALDAQQHQQSKEPEVDQSTVERENQNPSAEISKPIEQSNSAHEQETDPHIEEIEEIRSRGTGKNKGLNR